MYSRTLSLLSKVLCSLKAKIKWLIYAHLNLTTSLIPHSSSLLISHHFCYNYAIKSCTMLLPFLAIRHYFHLPEDKSSKRKKSISYTEEGTWVGLHNLGKNWIEIFLINYGIAIKIAVLQNAKIIYCVVRIAIIY